jgi:hypothetical protein
MSKLSIGGRGKLVWADRPSVSVFYALYGVLSLLVIGLLVVFELWLSSYAKVGGNLLPRNLVLGGIRIPYPVEIATAAIVLLLYLGKVIHLALLRARHKYELYEDGLYVDSGIVNLQNTFISPVAFSDARLIMPLSSRLVHRGKIIVDANDERHFTLLLVKNPLVVQNLIRRTLGHPVVRVESPSPPTSTA